MQLFLKNYRGFILPFLIFMAAGAWIQMTFSKADLHLFLTSFHTPAGDKIVPFLTWLGDGWFITGVTVLSLFFQYRTALMLGAANLIASGITQVLKTFVFDDHDRPSEFFQGITNLHLVPGVEIHAHYSFPSGHTTIAFATCLIFAGMKRSVLWQLSWFTGALLIGSTRIYLSQHFFNDIYAGAAIGTFVACISVLLTAKFGGKRLDGALFRNQ
ncbi:MAG: phosphatase PAP2 family protein [Bacteroidia bacterium]|nr:phosphatase PAP2 family protein [Bacteroidia bacterium]